MDVEQVTQALGAGVLVTLKLGGPMLILSLLVGVLVAIFQAVTQIHEQTLSFVLKLIVVLLVCVIGGDWMLNVLLDYTRDLFTLMLG